jgi:hypothetical protein
MLSVLTRSPTTWKRRCATANLASVWRTASACADCVMLRGKLLSARLLLEQQQYKAARVAYDSVLSRVALHRAAREHKLGSYATVDSCRALCVLTADAHAEYGGSLEFGTDGKLKALREYDAALALVPDHNIATPGRVQLLASWGILPVGQVLVF